MKNIKAASILAGISCVCTAGATALAVFGGIQVGKTEDWDALSLKEKAMVVLKYCWPAFLVSGASIGTGIASRAISIKEVGAAMAVGAAGVAAIKDDFEAYRHEVANEIGAEREAEVFTKAAEKRVIKGGSSLPDELEVEFHDTCNDIYFTSTVGKVMRGFAAINEAVFGFTSPDFFATWALFYEKIDRADLIRPDMYYSGWSYDICAVDWESYYIRFDLVKEDSRSDGEGAECWGIYPCVYPEDDIAKRIAEMEAEGII